jgi:hypothetical protein
VTDFVHEPLPKLGPAGSQGGCCGHNDFESHD